MNKYDFPYRKDYPLEELYIGLFNKRLEIFHANKMPVGVHYKFVTHEFLNNGANSEVDIIDPLKNYLEAIGLDVLLIRADGNYEKNLTQEEIEFLLNNIYKLRKLLPQDVKKIETVSEHLVQATSELLGINASLHPNNYHLNNDFNINEIIVSATKESIFKHNLFNFIKASFLTEQTVILVNESEFMDYRISRSLNVAKIPKSLEIKANGFNMRGNINGDITVNGKSINDKIDNGFQKKIKR